MAMRIYLLMRVDADIRIIRHMSDIARYMRILMRISASAWPSLVPTGSEEIITKINWKGQFLVHFGAFSVKRNQITKETNVVWPFHCRNLFLWLLNFQMFRELLHSCWILVGIPPLRGDCVCILPWNRVNLCSHYLWRSCLRWDYFCWYFCL